MDLYIQVYFISWNAVGRSPNQGDRWLALYRLLAKVNNPLTYRYQALTYLVAGFSAAARAPALLRINANARVNMMI
jgi:hypothetical protein